MAVIIICVLKYSFKEAVRPSGLMCSVLDTRSSGSGSIPGRGQIVLFLGKMFYFSVPFSTALYELHRGTGIGT